MDKIATNLEQSRKLVELGIDPSTADMHYSSWTILADGEFILSPNYGQTIEEMQEDYGNQIIPAWSLSALLQLMPRVGHSFPELCRGKETGLFYMWLDEEFDTQKYSNPIDAAFEMICWLKENRKI